MSTTSSGVSIWEKTPIRSTMRPPGPPWRPRRRPARGLRRVRSRPRQRTSVRLRSRWHSPSAPVAERPLKGRRPAGRRTPCRSAPPGWAVKGAFFTLSPLAGGYMFRCCTLALSPTVPSVRGLSPSFLGGPAKTRDKLFEAVLSLQPGSCGPHSPSQKLCSVSLFSTSTSPRPPFTNRPRSGEVWLAPLEPPASPSRGEGCSGLS